MNTAPSKDLNYYVLFLVAALVLVALCSGCNNISAPELNTRVTYPPPVAPTVTLSVGMINPTSPPQPAGYLAVWLVADMEGDAARTQYIEWDYGDGSPVQHEYFQPGTVHTYPPAGRWTVTATVHEVTGRTTTGLMQLILP